MPNRPEFQITHDRLGRAVSNKGASRAVKFAKHQEAEERNAATEPSKRRSYWRALGFDRQSHAARVIAQTVSEGNQIANVIREKSGLSDWAPLPS